MIQIIEIKNPFEPNKREIKEVYCTGGPLTDYVDIVGRDICIEGRIIERPDAFIPLDNMQIIVTPHIAGKGVKNVLGLVAMVALSVYSAGIAGGAWGTFATTGSHFLAAGTFSAYLASGAVMFLGGKLINSVFPQDSASIHFKDQEQTRTYGWDIPTPVTTAGYTVGETYGECIPAAQLLEQHVETVNDKQYLNLLYCGGYGPVDSIDNIRIDKTDISNFSNVQIETRLGTNDQEPISFFKNTPLDQNVGLELDTDLSLTRTSNSTQANILEITLEWPAGLYQMNNDGSYANASVRFRAEYRRTGNGAWHNFNVDNSDYTVTAATNSALRRTFQVTGLEAAQYDVRVTMIERPKTSRYQTMTQWSILTSYVNGIYSRPNKVLVALRILASNQLSNGVPSVNWRQKRNTVWVHDADSNSYVEKAADNPIWATYDILHGCRKLYNINLRTYEYVVAGYPHEAMDAYWEEWKAAADYADEMVVNNDGELEPRFRFDAFYDSAMKRWDAAQKAASVGHASIIMHGRNIGIVVDRPGTMTQIFGEGRTTVSSVKGSFSSTEDRARAIEVTYSDGLNDFKNTMMTIRSLDYAESKSSDNTAQLQLFGVKRRSQAYREAVHALATNERQLQFIELGADIDAVVAEYGDIVGYNHAVSRVGIASGRIISCNGNTVVLDHDVTLEPEKMYELYIQLPDDTLIRRDVIPGNETTNEIIVAEPFVSPQMPQRFDNYAFGELNKAVKPFRVVSAQRDGDMRVTLKLAEYDEAIYSDDLDYSKFPVIDYSSSPITGNIIESLTATEETYTTNEGALTSNIIISWSLRRDANYVPDSYRVTVVNTTTGFSEEFNTRATTQYVRGVSPKATYTITVRCIFDAVVVGSISTELYITGKDAPPPDVTGLKCKQTAGGFVLSWDPIEIKDLRGFTIWQGVDGVGIDGCDKINDCYSGTSLFVPVTEAENYIFYVVAIDNGGNMSQVPVSIIAEYILPDDITDFIGVRNGETITFSWDAQDGMSYELRWGTSWDTAHIVVKLKSNMYMYFFPQLGTQTFCVKAIDGYGNYSKNPAYVSLDLTDGVNRNVIAVFDDQHDGWQGVKNNVHVMDGRLVLDDNVTGGEYIAEITLPEAIPARNWIQYHAGTVASDVVWSDMLYPWNEVPGAWYPEGDLGSGKVEHYISTYTGLSNTTVDAISLNNTTDSDKGSAVVSESQGIAYENGRFAKGARISDIASLAYTVSIPAVFHLAFNAKHTTAINNHIIYMTLVGSGRWLRLGYNSGTFYLLDSNGRRITVNISPHADDIISFTIDQTTDNRSLTVECLAMNTTRTVSAEYEPLGTFTGFKLE